MDLMTRLARRRRTNMNYDNEDVVADGDGDATNNSSMLICLLEGKSMRAAPQILSLMSLKTS